MKTSHLLATAAIVIVPVLISCKKSQVVVEDNCKKSQVVVEDNTIERAEIESKSIKIDRNLPKSADVEIHGRGGGDLSTRSRQRNAP